MTFANTAPPQLGFAKSRWRNTEIGKDRSLQSAPYD